MAIRDIVTMGYGSFSRVGLIPVLGYGLGTDYIPPSVAGASFALGWDATHYDIDKQTHYALDSGAMHYAVPVEE